MATATGGSPQLWLTLLLFSTQKSVVSLNPPWIRIFKGETVTLTCNKNNSREENSTEWMHNGIVSNVKTTYWEIVNATIQDSGNYTCQSQPFSESKPVHLEVTADWLLLQASADMVREGGSFYIRCHGWKNRIVHKVIYYKDNFAFKYLYESPNIFFRNATFNNSGNYHCTGNLQQLTRTSEPFRITVMKAHQSKYYWLQPIIQILVVILFVVDTGLLVSTQEELKFVLKVQETGKANKIQ
uniref:Fc receptor, IgE, high affinity I, alpha polypeptide n=2 Tax=Nannospalax galili TaxID=1026970 RepID=A0A8C6W6Q9_NANGA